MKRKLSLVFLILIAAPLAVPLTTPLWALDPQGTGIDPTENSVFLEANDADLSEFVWKSRPLAVFSDSPDDPRFIQQMDNLRARPDDLLLRDVVVLTDTDPSLDSPMRAQLRPRGFMLVLLAKDGTIVLRKPFPWKVREITRAIDKLPLRQQEVRDRRSSELP